MLNQQRFGARYKAQLQPVLDTFYKEVACPSDNPILSKLRTLSKKILQNVEKIDSRFEFDVNDVGSLASGVSAVVACEFDMLLCLDIEGKDEESVLSPCYAKFKMSSSSAKIWSDAADGRYLNPRKLTDIFQKCVKKVMRKMIDEIGDQYKVGGEGSVATTVSTENESGKYKADLVIAVKCEGWPSSANATWLQPGYNKAWPTQDVISHIKDNGYEMVAKFVSKTTPGVKDAGPDLGLLWRLSVSRAETLLLKSLEKRYCYRKLLIIFKSLRLNHLVRTSGGRKPRDMTLILTSYHLKTMLFHQAQACPHSSQWTDDKLAERFFTYLFDIHWRVHGQDMSPFFFPGVNLCENRGITQSGLWLKLFGSLITDPKSYIESCLPFDESQKYLYSYYTSL